MQDKGIKRQSGQALVEYALILVLVGLAFGFALAATGPVVGNVFSNTVYNLVGEEPTRRAQEPGDFWITVTWVNDNPLGETPLPTRTLAPPSTTPTPGSPPPPTPVTPSRTPLPTITPRPTSTPEDFAHRAPFYDSVDNAEWWRVDAEPFLGSEDWLGEYYDNTNLSGEPVFTRYNADMCPTEPENACKGKIDFNWGNGGPTDGMRDNFSVRYSRNYLWDSPDPIDVVISAGRDDGMRIWIFGEGQDAGNCPGCLVLDEWRNGNNDEVATATIQPGPGRMVVEYYENGGGARVSMEIGISDNVDDTLVDGGGNPIAGSSAMCNWAQNDREDDANSFDFFWEEFVGGRDEFPRNTRCHLEFRGYVYVPGTGDPDPMARPQFTFWDVWDFGDNNKQAWLEVAEYVPQTGFDNRLNRAAVNWIPVDLYNGASKNYNWTHHIIDLTDVRGDGGATVDDNFSGKNVTFRFVMQNGNSDDRRRWYIDDIEFFDADHGEFGPNTFFTLNEANVEANFITSGHWNLNANRARPDFDNADINPEGCCSWELTGRDGGDYERFSTGDRNNNRENHRVHFVEFNGFVNVDPADYPTDDEGDTGDPMLDFYHAYDVGRYTGLEVQYTTDPYVSPQGPNWQVVPSTTGDPAGQLRDVANNSNNDGYQPGLEFTQVNLGALADAGIYEFRLRFAMLVRNDANTRDGWWIDEPRIHREDRPRFLDYPFEDSAEIGVDNWRTSGTWFRTNTSARTGDHSFTDSPGGEYEDNSDTNMQFIYPIDLNNDTPDNLALTDRNPAGGNSGGAAVDPVLTFWHWRDLQSRANIYVDWRLMSGNEGDWEPLWAFVDGMNTNPSNNSNRTRDQKAWEFIHVELDKIMNSYSTTNADTADDDILIRFRLDVNNTRNDDGIYIDDIRLEERAPEIVHRLWPNGESRTVGGEDFGAGDAPAYGSDLEEPNWFENWIVGGDWEVIDWEQHNGLQAFHDSAQGQTEAYYGNGWDTLPKTRDETFNVLNLNTIIDLRATQIEEEPTLYFWSRYFTGNDDHLAVQISYELDMTEAEMDVEMGTRCRNNNLPQCYEQERGWSEWINTDTKSQWPWHIGEWSRTYTWQRQQVDLSEYAASDATNPGERIRIRFVSDALERDDNADGWYLDNIVIGPRQDEVIRNLADGAFSDPARNLDNWVAEGFWGLSPELSRGSGSGPVALGTWQEYWWNCNDCEDLAPNGTPRSYEFRVGADIFLDGSDGSDADATRTVLDINYDERRGRPRSGINTDRILGRWVLDTPVIGPSTGVQGGEYNFITISDDGVRMKYEILNADGSTTPIDGPPADDQEEWNVIYNWTDHGRTGDMGRINLEDGRRYRVTLEYYEKGSDMVIILTTGGNSFSFTDTPKQGPGAAFPDIAAIPRSDPSLILAGTLDLAGTTTPIIQYYTYYETYGGLRVEVSTDGGFTWTENGLASDLVLPSGATERMDDPSYGGEYMPDDGDWRRRLHNLSDYVDQQVMVRFRYDNSNRGNLNEDRDRDNNYMVSWWIVDIRIGQ